MTMFKKQQNSKNKGFSLVEVLVGSGILSVVIVTAVYSIIQIQKLERRTASTIRANYLLLEAVDVVKILRDNSWTSNVTTLTRSTPYYLVWDSGAWEATTTQSVIDDKYYRYIELEDVTRDGNDNIAVSGTTDPGTLKLTAKVEWLNHSGTSTRQFETYITDLYAN